METYIMPTRLSPEAVSEPKSIGKVGEIATKVALLVRSLGRATTETRVATKWDRFVQLAKEAA